MCVQVRCHLLGSSFFLLCCLDAVCALSIRFSCCFEARRGNATRATKRVIEVKSLFDGLSKHVCEQRSIMICVSFEDSSGDMGAVFIWNAVVCDFSLSGELNIMC